MVAYDPTLTINVIGDLHHGWTPTARLDAAKADLIASASSCAHRVYLGDLTDLGTNATYRSAAYAFLHDIGGSFDYVYGNHDYSGISVATINAEWGDYAALNWVRDLPFCRIIGLNNNQITDGNQPCTLSPATLAWLGDRLAETAKLCVIATHAPLMNTVASWYTSFGLFFSTQPDADFRAVLDAHANARVVVSGHTHSKYDATGAVSRVAMTGHDVLAINASAIAYVTDPGPPSSPSDSLDDILCSPFLTFQPDRIEIRWRNHATGTWFTGPTTEALYTVPPAPQSSTRTGGGGPLIIADRGMSVAQRSALASATDWSAALISNSTSDARAAGGPLTIYTGPLSDARRALVNAAIDSNGATDIWTLFEEWEANGLALDLLSLPDGRGAVGLAGHGIAADILSLPSARGLTLGDTKPHTATLTGLDAPLYRGDDRQVTIAITDADGDAVPLYGCTVWFTVKSAGDTRSDDLNALAQCTAVIGNDGALTGSGITADDIASGSLNAAFTVPLGACKYDVQVRDVNGAVRTIASGTFTGAGDVTRDTSAS